MDGAEVLQQLWDDHRVSAHLMRVLRAQLPAALEGNPESLRVVCDIVAREREYGDGVHHAREELLFSRMAARDETGAEAVKGLTHDHDELARMGATALESLQARLAGGREDPKLLGERLRGYADALRNHMAKEEQRVFPLAGDLLKREDWVQVAAAFEGRADPLAPPVSPRFQALEAWLASHGEGVFDGPGPAA